MKTTTTEFQLVDVDKTIPYTNNARTHSPEQIIRLRTSLFTHRRISDGSSHLMRTYLPSR